MSTDRTLNRHTNMKFRGISWIQINSKGNSPQVCGFPANQNDTNKQISFIQSTTKLSWTFIEISQAKASAILVIGTKIPLNVELVIKKWFYFITTQSLFKEPHERSRCKKINFHLIEQLAINWTSSNVKVNLTFFWPNPRTPFNGVRKIKKGSPDRPESIDWLVHSEPHRLVNDYLAIHEQLIQWPSICRPAPNERPFIWCQGCDFVTFSNVLFT
jgi:hypothetical protein